MKVPTVGRRARENPKGFLQQPRQIGRSAGSHRDRQRLPVT